MESTLTKKNLILVGLEYFLYVLVVNFITMLLTNIESSTLSAMIIDSPENNQFITFLTNHAIFANTLTVLSFVIPTLTFLTYILFANESNMHKRFINLPIFASFMGASGWLIQALKQVFLYLMFYFQTGSLIWSFLISQIIVLGLNCIFSFTLCFMDLNIQHRKYFLKKYFPDGHLTQYKGARHISVSGLIFIFFMSAAFIPILYVFSAYFSEITKNNGTFSFDFILLFTVFCTVSIGVTISFSFFISAPLKAIKTATEKIKAGELGYKINGVSNDTFGDLGDTLNDMSVSLKEKSEKVDLMQNSIIEGMATMVESRDNSTGGHILRTSACVRVFAAKLKQHPDYQNYSEEFFNYVIKAAPMHDLGKIAVDDAVLRKPGRFTDEEYEKMKVHAKEGAKIVQSVLKNVDDEEFKTIAQNVAHYHHEKWNGSGYPEKLSGDQIPIEARIMALADVFDALVSKRCYKESMSYDKAFEIIKNDLGTHFDPKLGGIFIDCRPELIDLYGRI